MLSTLTSINCSFRSVLCLSRVDFARGRLGCVVLFYPVLSDGFQPVHGP